MNTASLHWPNCLPRLLWIRHKCPRCDSLEFKAAELRSFDAVLSMETFEHVPQRPFVRELARVVNRSNASC